MNDEIRAPMSVERNETNLTSAEARSEAPSDVAAGRTQRVVIVGNGMVGHRLCELLTQTSDFSVVVFGEEPRPAYDRVALTSYFVKRSADELGLADRAWYGERGIDLRLGQRITSIDRANHEVVTAAGERVGYDFLVLATGSAPFVPPMPGVDKAGVFVYRTIEDLDAIRTWSRHSARAVVLGGGLLGLEAAKAVLDLGLATTVVEFAPRLMPRQLDGAGARLLQKKVRSLGVDIQLSRRTTAILGEERVEALSFAEGDLLPTDMVVISAGIRPRDELARAAGLVVGERGGILVDDRMTTSDPHVFAIGECALHRGTIYGLVAPGYQMADVLAANLRGARQVFAGIDQSAKLKLLGVDVASLGDPFADERGAPSVAFEDLVKGVYKKVVFSEDEERVLGAILVGDVKEYGLLLSLMRGGQPIGVSPASLILPANDGQTKAAAAMADDAQVCSCNNVCNKQIRDVVRGGCGSVAEVKAKTRAGTSCGGCAPLVTDIVDAELKAMGQSVKRNLCEHFAFTRQELYQIVRIKAIRTFAELLASHGQGHGCEICKPTVASILASVHAELIVREEHATLQDTNDRFLANIQRSGLYSVVPRVPGGEITPEKLIVLGQVAQKYGLYTKLTGGQRIDLFGAHLEQLPDIWEELVRAGFESGHAYGKALRTVKSCVGSTWCRYGVQDSVGFAIRIEERYKGVRAPHKIKGGVSGCVRECAEAQGKDFGIIATEKGYNLYVCGNGGAKPKHAVLFASDLDEATVTRYLDRFLMLYIKTADRLTRTSVWLEKLEGGIEYLRQVVIEDKLGICAELEQQMQHLVDQYRCEWAEVVGNPQARARFRHFANSSEPDDTVVFVEERGQRRPADWHKGGAEPSRGNGLRLPVLQPQGGLQADIDGQMSAVLTPSSPAHDDDMHVGAAASLEHPANEDHGTLPPESGELSWVKVGLVENFPIDGGMAVRYGSSQIAVYNFTSRGEWFATQNRCPHKGDAVLARGIVGDQNGEPKVACPLHKKVFSLASGQCLSGDPYAVRTYPVKVEDGAVYVQLPVEDELRAPMTIDDQALSWSCQTDVTWSAHVDTASLSPAE